MTLSTQTPAERPYSSKNLIYFIVCLGIALMGTWLVKEPEFTQSQVYVLFITFFAIGLWITEAIPPFAVGLFIMAYLVFTMGNPLFNIQPEPIDIYVNTFSSSIIWLMLGGFFLAIALEKTQLDETLLRFILRLSGHNPKRILIGIVLTTMFISTMMSNAATTAMVLAALMPLLNKFGKSNFSKALLLGIAAASTTGGIATIIGNPPNALAAGLLEKAGHEISFLEWIVIGLPISLLLTGLVLMFLLYKYFKGNHVETVDFVMPEKTVVSNHARRERTIVFLVTLITLILWLTTSVHHITVAAVSAVPLVVLTVTGVLTGVDLKKLPWEILFLIAGGMSLGVALEHTGLLHHYSLLLSDVDVHPILYLILLGYITMVATAFMSDTATSIIFIPMGMTILPEYQKEVGLIVAIAASTATFLPVSTISNSIVYSTGLLEQKDFRQVAAIIGITGTLAAVFWVLLVG